MSAIIHLGIRKANIKTGTFLRKIGVKVKPGAGFWLINEPELPYIYHDYKQRVRALQAQHHPDRGGDREQFVMLGRLIEQTENGFARYGIAPPPSPREREEKAERDKIKNLQAHKRWQRDNQAKLAGYNETAKARAKEKRRRARLARMGSPEEQAALKEARRKAKVKYNTEWNARNKGKVKRVSSGN